MFGVINVYIDTVFGLYGVGFFFLRGGGGGGCFLFLFKLLSWIFQYDCFDTCCFECLICMCFVSAQLSMFHVEGPSRNTHILLLLLLLIIINSCHVPGFIRSALAWLAHWQYSVIGLVPTLPCAWHYRVSIGLVGPLAVFCDWSR